MSLVEHARRELERCGQTAEDPEYAESIIKAVEAFASYDHSASSAWVAREQLYSLLAFEVLSPLTTDPAEWMQVDDQLWQSRRDPQAFSRDGGRSYQVPAERDTVGSVPLHLSAPAQEKTERS